MKNNLTILIAVLAIHTAFAQCPQPTGISYSNVTYFSAVINYPGYSGQNWIVEWGSPGFIPGTGSGAGGGYVVGSNAVSVNVIFNAGPDLQFYVRQYCPSSGAYGPNSAVVSLTLAPCQSGNQIILGGVYGWSFYDRGVVDQYPSSCTGANYYGNEFIGSFYYGFGNYTLDATYTNSTGSAKNFAFLMDEDPTQSWCGPQGVTCGDLITVPAASSVTRRYSISPIMTLEMWFDSDDTSGYTSGQFSITSTCATTPPTSVMVSPSNTVCLGTPVTFTQVGGALPPGGNYYWYRGTCNRGTLIGTGSSFTFTPTAGDFYYVRVEAPCGVSYCVSFILYVSKPVQISTADATLLCPYYSAHLSANAGNSSNTFQWLRDGINISGATHSTYDANQAGNYQCSVINACGSTLSNTISITQSSNPVATITAGGPTAFCISGSVTLSATTGAGYSYQWKKSGNIIINGATNPTYVATVQETYYCAVTNNCGTALSNPIIVIVSTSPPTGGISSSNLNICPSGTATLTASGIPGYSFQWRLNNSAISGATGQNFSATVVGNYDCIIGNGCGSITSNVLTVVSTPTATITAGGATSFCSGGSVTLSANTGSGITYQWNRSGAAITGATASTYVASITGSYTCQITRCGSNATSNSIGVTARTGPVATITGPTSLCPTGSVTLTANSGALTYQWRLNSVNISGATLSTYVATSVGAYDCVETDNCGTSTSNVKNVNAGVLPSGFISMFGSTTLCPGSTDHLFINTWHPGETFQWQLNGVNISGATSTTYYPTVSGNYSCFMVGSCGSVTSNSITVTVLIAPSVTISAAGSTTFCQGGSVTLTAIASPGSTYQWSKNGITITGASTSTYIATTSGSYASRVGNSCGFAISNAISVSVSGTAPAKPGTITGPSTFCSYQSGVVYSIVAVANATSYNWQVPTGATITSGQGTISITVTYGNKSGNIKVAASNSCGTSAYQQKKVTRTCRESEIEPEQNSTLEILVFPNPGIGPFTLKVSGNDVEHFTFRVFDLTGRCMETFEGENGSDIIEFGYALSPGIYIGEFISGEERKLVRIVRQD